MLLSLWLAEGFPLQSSQLIFLAIPPAFLWQMLGPLALQLAGNPLESRHGLGRHCDPALTSEPDGFISIPKEA